MITNILKVFLATTSIGMFFYSGSVFAFSVGHLFLLVLAMLIVLSIFYIPLTILVTNLCKVVGVLSVLAFVLLMLAGTIGGSFNLSSSNQVIAALLGGMSLFGLTAFFWLDKPNVSK